MDIYTLTISYTQLHDGHGEDINFTRTIIIDANDNCLTTGLRGMPENNNKNLRYIIGSPMKTIDFMGIENDECEYSLAYNIAGASTMSSNDLGLTFIAENLEVY